MSKLFVRLALLISMILGASCATAPKGDSARLRATIEKFAAARKRVDPFNAPYFEVEEDLPKFGDFPSPEMIARTKAVYEDAATSLKTINPANLSAKDLLAYKLFKNDVELKLAALTLPFEYFDFSQMENRFREYLDDSSPALTAFPFDSVAHYRAFIKRSEGFPAFVDRQIANLRTGASKGYALNCTIAKNAIQTYKDGLTSPAEKNPFYRPATKFPTSFSAKERKELELEFFSMVNERILPGFRKFDSFYQKEYLPKCRKSFGIGSLPKGPEMYALRVRASTDSKLTPKEIHAIGLKEVARIREEMNAIRSQVGFKGNLKAFLKHLTADPKYFFKSPDDLISAFNAYRAKVALEVPKAFSLSPKSDFKIVESENTEDAAASYRVPTEYQPYGRFLVNAKNLKTTPTYGVNTLYLHEAVPGHHYQMALVFEMKDQLSEYQRKMFFSNAFIEGWALYAERWGREVGLVSEPLQLMGSLSDEMLRAVRLVVDTGIHSLGWSRERAISFMQDNVAADRRDVEIEIDRYSVWPGQALAYKLGQLKILELRERAKTHLGDRFDIREFHRIVIGSGTVSLSVLEENVDAWLAKAH